MFACCHEARLEGHHTPPVVLLALLALAVLAFAGVGRLVHRFHEQEEALARHLYQRGAKAQTDGRAEEALGAFRGPVVHCADFRPLERVISRDEVLEKYKMAQRA